mmetsp:Transcript_25244/g.22249  ORF Transcript_25244/g.22249 Transcript_25244/m.22249 type:complete len:282 (+) Transcript_25244:387-1232(+)
MVTQEDIQSAYNEKYVLRNAHHPFIVRLRYSFHNENNVYLIMDYCPGGELYHHLKKLSALDEDVVKFYIAELVLALEYLHDHLNVIYRDLKPENILLDEKGHVCLIDFGLTKTEKTAKSICGTLQYIAPEVFQGRGYDMRVDWWSLGCVMYELLIGRPPFNGKDREEIEKSIKYDRPEMKGYLSRNAQDLLKKLMHKNPNQRFGSRGAYEIKQHKFFSDINWNEVYDKKNSPPIKPQVAKSDDVRNFDKEFIEQVPAETPRNELVTDEENKKFDWKNFNYS